MRHLFTFIHVSLISLIGVQHLLLHFVSFVTTALSINLIQTLYVYGPELLRTIVFNTPWPSSRSLLYKLHNYMKRAPRKSKPLCQTTVSRPFAHFCFSLLADAVDGGSSQVGGPRKIPCD